MKKLVVNADDFGFTKDVNQGIIEAHTQGILTATTLMANASAFDDAVRLAHAHPRLDVGCHLVLVGGPGQPRTIPDLLRALWSGKLRPYDELRPQIERILAAGIRPLHLDTHKHTHLWPSVLDAVVRLSEDFRIPWVRRPFDIPLSGQGIPLGKRMLSKSLESMRRQFHTKLLRHGCRTTDHFAGFQMTGRYSSAELAALIRGLPEGSTEFMCHPGRCTEELRGAATRLKESRELELQALTAPEVRTALDESGVRLVRYAEL